VSHARSQAGVMANGFWLPKVEIDRRLAKLKLR